MSEATVISEAIYRMEGELEKLNKKLEAVTADRDTWRHTAGVYQAENDNLRRVINRANSKADHYMKQHAGLSTGLRAMAQSFLELIRNSESHAYGDRSGARATPRANVAQRSNEVHDEAVPSFLTQGPRTEKIRAVQ
jgi:hypothetical protein